MPIANFTVNPVTFSSEAGIDFTINNPTETLLLIPNAGYTLTAASFSATAPLPNYVDSVVFTQVGLNVNCIITYLSPSFMPAADVFVQVYSTGVAELAQFSVAGVINFSGLQNVSSPTASSQSYTAQGNFNSAANVSTFTVIANSGYFFPNAPAASIAVGNESRYSITSTNTLDSNGNIIQTYFQVVYTFPSTNVTGDLINISGIANELYSPPVKIQAYTINTGAVAITGATRTFTVLGVAGAAWNLTYYESVNNTLVGQFSGIIGSNGSTSVNIIFPSSTVDVDYTFALTGDLSSTFCTIFPWSPCSTGQPSVWQILQKTDSRVSFRLTSSNPNITVGPGASLSFPFGSTPGLRTYKVQASSIDPDFVWDILPTAQSWTNQGLNDPNSNQVVQSPLNIVINNNPATISTEVVAADLLAAYQDLMSFPTTATIATPITTTTFTPGVYLVTSAGSIAANAVITLDGAGAYIFKFTGALGMGTGVTIILSNGATQEDIFWIAEGALTVGTNCNVYGNLISNSGAVSVASGCSVNGRLLAVNAGAISISSSTAIIPSLTLVVDFGLIERFVFFTKGGVISNTGTSAITGDIGTWTGSISTATFAAPTTVDGDYYTSTSPIPVNSTLGIKFSTLISSVGSQDLLSILNLDNFLQGSSYAPISLFYGITEEEACCNPFSVSYFILNSETFDTATAILLADGSPAPNGFYINQIN